MMVKMKILVLWGFNKKSDFKGGSRKQNNMQGVATSKGEGVWTVCRFKGGWRKRGGSAFDGEVDTKMHMS